MSKPQIVTTLAPAKINLTLDVGPRRADGYHDIDSIVTPIHLFDALSIRWEHNQHPVSVQINCTNSVQINCTNNDRSPCDLPTDRTNLAVRAAYEFCERGDFSGRVSITLLKCIPTQAGLGGGSSDAAAVLCLLNQTAPEPLPENVLHDIAAGIGSDVPLFLYNGPVQIRGRGEQVEALPFTLPKMMGILVRPDVGVPTGPAYALLDAIPDRVPGNATAKLLDVLAHDPTTDQIVACLSNDFEAAVLPAYPAIARVCDALRAQGALATLLCGSGSTVFGLFDTGNVERAWKVLREQSEPGQWVYPAILPFNGNEIEGEYHT